MSCRITICISHPWSARREPVLGRKRGGKWTQGDHFRLGKLVRSAYVDCRGGGNAPRPHTSYIQSGSQLRAEAQPRGPAIGRRVLPPEVAGLLSQWGRERPPSAGAFGVPAPSKGVAHAPTRSPDGPAWSGPDMGRPEGRLSAPALSANCSHPVLEPFRRRMVLHAASSPSCL